MQTLLEFKNIPSAQDSPIQIQADVQFFKEHDALKWRLLYKVSDSEKQVVWTKIRTNSAEKKRAELLWQKTCFEMFFRIPNQDHYYEINLDEISHWNVYSFQQYRYPSPPMAELNASLSSFSFDSHSLSLSAEMKLEDFFKKQKINELEINLTAILKLQSGLPSYWATKHAKEKPDFHDPLSLTMKRKIHGT